MAKDFDPNGSPKETTSYSAEPAPPRPDKDRSGWALGVMLVLIVMALIFLFSWPRSGANPQPGAAIRGIENKAPLLRNNGIDQ